MFLIAVRIIWLIKGGNTMNEKDLEIRNEITKVKEKWRRRAEASHEAHFAAGNFYERIFLVLGCTVVILSAALGSAEVLVPSSQIENIGGDRVKALAGVISLFIAILAGLQTFLKFSQKAEP
jgi:hypothetical protein